MILNFLQCRKYNLYNIFWRFKGYYSDQTLYRFLVKINIRCSMYSLYKKLRSSFFFVTMYSIRSWIDAKNMYKQIDHIVQKDKLLVLQNVEKIIAELARSWLCLDNWFQFYHFKIDLYKFNNFHDVVPDPSDGPTERRVSRAPPFEKRWHRMIIYLQYYYISIFVFMNILNTG